MNERYLQNRKAFIPYCAMLKKQHKNTETRKTCLDSIFLAPYRKHLALQYCIISTSTKPVLKDHTYVLKKQYITTQLPHSSPRASVVSTLCIFQLRHNQYQKMQSSSHDNKTAVEKHPNKFTSSTADLLNNQTSIILTKYNSALNPQFSRL